MKIKKAELLQALNEVKPGLATRSLLQQMENATFTGQDIITYNDQICVLYPFETDFEVSINHTDLYKIVSKIPTESFDISVDGNMVTLISESENESTKAELIPILEDEIGENINSLVEQLPSEGNEFEWQELPKDFMQGALLCIPAASTDMAQGVLTCLYVNGKELICSDNLRVSYFELSKDTNSEFFIKATIVRELSQFKFIWFCVANSWVHFQTENGAIFSVRLIRGKGLDYFKKLFDGFKGEVIELPEGMKEFVDSASVMTSKDDQTMFISFRKNEIVCETQNSRGRIEKRKTLKYSSKTPIEFSISATFLQQILGLPLKMIVGENKSLFESGSFKHVLIHKMV